MAAKGRIQAVKYAFAVGCHWPDLYLGGWGAGFAAQIKALTPGQPEPAFEAAVLNAHTSCAYPASLREGGYEGG